MATDESLAAPLAFAGAAPGVDFNLALDGDPARVTLSESTVTFTGQEDRAATIATLMLSAANDDDATNETGTVTIPSSGDGPILVATDLKDGATTTRWRWIRRRPALWRSPLPVAAGARQRCVMP